MEACWRSRRRTRRRSWRASSRSISTPPRSPSRTSKPSRRRPSPRSDGSTRSTCTPSKTTRARSTSSSARWATSSPRRCCGSSSRLSASPSSRDTCRRAAPRLRCTVVRLRCTSAAPACISLHLAASRAACRRCTTTPTAWRGPSTRRCSLPVTPSKGTRPPSMASWRGWRRRGGGGGSRPAARRLRRRRRRGWMRTRRSGCAWRRAIHSRPWSSRRATGGTSCLPSCAGARDQQMAGAACCSCVRRVAVQGGEAASH